MIEIELSMKSGDEMKNWKTGSEFVILRLISGRSNVFLITYKRKTILVDTSAAFMKGKLQNVLDHLEIDTIDYLILTHAHFDHTANAFYIKERYHSSVIIHKTEAQFLKSGKNPGIRGTNLLTSAMVNLFGNMYLSRSAYHPCDFDITLDEELNLDHFESKIKIIHTPGHTCGSVSIIVDNEIAIVGDAMFGVFKNSVLPPYAENKNQLVESWGKLIETGCQIFIPSHGNEKSLKQLKKEYEKQKSY